MTPTINELAKLRNYKKSQFKREQIRINGAYVPALAGKSCTVRSLGMDVVITCSDATKLRAFMKLVMPSFEMEIDLVEPTYTFKQGAVERRKYRRKVVRK